MKWQLLACGCLLVGSLASADEPIELRWVYVQQNLQVRENIPKVEAILRRAAAAGYNGVVLADYKLNVLDRVPEHYFTNAEQFKKICAELQLEIIPTVAGFGYSSGILAHDPNLAEGLPVQEAPFRVHGEQAVPADSQRNLIPGGFEERKGDAFAGWSFQDEPSAGSFADLDIKHGGQCSLRIDNPAGQQGNRRVSKSIVVRPWGQYHASVWVRTREFESAGTARMFAMGADGRVLSHSNLGVKRDQEWTQHHIIFNSLDNREVRFYLGVWDCGSGQLWLDDARLVEEPLVNLVRRPGCPLVVSDAATKTVYEEGKDFAELRDPRMGNTPWAGEFDIYHEPPVLRLLAGSRIRDGQQLLVSYYHAVTIYDGQVPCSLTEPRVFEVVADQVRRVNDLFQPRTFFLSHDEIRVANWSQPERDSGHTAGQQLAENVRRCAEIVRSVKQDARLCIWSDMFDPAHNAQSKFYLVNGDLAGSWEGLPADTIIVNWNHGQADKSLSFFAERGHGQILAGFYDAPVARIDDWVKAARKVGGPRGVMYTTWTGDYSQLEAFAQSAK